MENNAEMVEVLRESGMPYTPDAGGLRLLIQDFKTLHERYVNQVIANVHIEVNNRRDSLHAWLNEQADKHAAAIWANDPAVKAHIAQLRAWAEVVKGQ